MNLLAKIALSTLAWEVCWWAIGKLDRRKLYSEAKEAALRHKKPLLVVGEPDNEYPCGDITVDIRDKSVCLVYAKTNVENLSQFKDKQFGAAFVSHVIEHLCNPQKALDELTRVADEIYIAYPKMWRLATLLVPGHAWLIDKKPDGAIKLYKWIGNCNVPSRLGT